MVAEQVLVTKSDFAADRFRLVELNADVERALRAGDRVFIVGAPGDRAVLCTPSKSFFLAKEDTSNLRLLTEHTQWDAAKGGDAERGDARREIVVRGSARSHFVVRALGFIRGGDRRMALTLLDAYAHVSVQLQPKGQDVMRLKALLMESPFEHSRAGKVCGELLR